MTEKLQEKQRRIYKPFTNCFPAMGKSARTSPMGESIGSLPAKPPVFLPDEGTSACQSCLRFFTGSQLPPSRKSGSIQALYRPGSAFLLIPLQEKQSLPAFYCFTAARRMGPLLAKAVCAPPAGRALRFSRADPAPCAGQPSPLRARPASFCSHHKGHKTFPRAVF